MDIGVTEILVTALGILGGGGGLFSLVTSLKKNKRDDFSEIVEMLKEDNARLRADLEKMKTEMAEMEIRHDKEIERMNRLHSTDQKRLVELNSKLLLLETATQSSPFPTWLKDSSGVMLLCNTAYEDYFLKPIGLAAKDYIFRTDEDVWGAEIADNYKIGDTYAKENPGKYFIGTEKIILDGRDHSHKWRVVKYGRFVNNVCVGITGMAIPI
jgi:PAS domain-containing protein